MNALQETRPLTPRRWTIILLCAGLVLLVAAVRLFCIAYFGSALPFWDQWDGEGWAINRPLLLGTLDFQHLLSAHNEHRTFPSRVLAIAMLTLNGNQWDAIPPLVLNAFLAGLTAAMMAAFTIRRAPRDVAIPLVILIALCYVIPTGWENTLFGFQTAFYILNALVLAGIGGAVVIRSKWMLPFYCGAICLLAIFTLGSGALLVPAMGLALLLRLRTDPKSAPAVVPALLVLGTMMVIAAWLRVDYPPHEFLRAQNVGEYLQALWCILSWPLPSIGALSLILWIPGLVGGWRILAGQDRRAFSIAVVAIAACTIAQAAATAWVRGHGLVAVSSRYTDVFMLGVLANSFFFIDQILRLASRPSGIPRDAVRLGAALAAMLILLILGVRAEQSRVQMTTRGIELTHQRVNVLAYLNGAGTSALTGKPLLHIPYPNPERLGMFLDDPTIRAMLRPHLFIETIEMPARVRELDPSIGPLSIAGRHLISRRLLVLSGGLALTLMALWLLIVARHGDAAPRQDATTRDQ